MISTYKENKIRSTRVLLNIKCIAMKNVLVETSGLFIFLLNILAKYMYDIEVLMIDLCNIYIYEWMDGCSVSLCYTQI